MRNFKRCICKNKIKPNSAICYFAAASVKLMRLHGGNWHKIQLKGSPFLLCYSSFMPALISEELVCHEEENSTESVYGLSSLHPIYKYIQRDSSEGEVFICISIADWYQGNSPPFSWLGYAASGGPWQRKLSLLSTVISSICSKANQWEPRSSGKPGVPRGQVCIQLFIVLLSSKLNHREKWSLRTCS